MALILSIILAVLLILIGEERGVSAVLTLLGNALLLFVCIVLISRGWNVYLVFLAGSILFSVLTLFGQNKVNVKTISALVSVVTVVCLLMGFCALLVLLAHLGGYSEMDLYGDEATFLNNAIGIKSYEIMIAVVLLGLLGAIMDTSLSISTALYEVYNNNKEMELKQLITSGNHIGGDILGTTVNTLFFACVGESLFLMMMFARYHYGIAELFNSKAFLQELMMIIVSNLGCLIIIPLTSVVTARFMVKSQKSKVTQ